MFYSIENLTTHISSIRRSQRVHLLEMNFRKTNECDHDVTTFTKINLNSGYLALKEIVRWKFLKIVRKGHLKRPYDVVVKQLHNFPFSRWRRYNYTSKM